ncbi:MAG: HK97 gp10 family phage protein [Oscillospiraceae bacterium]|nr:HK97 gp10 family phage protein [Oscillospiraceae bacterium]
MNFGDALQKRMDELAKRQPMIQKRFREIAKGATLRAVEEATDKTPPNTYADGEIRGVHTITGELSQHARGRWREVSQTTPVQVGSDFCTTLKNDKRYASYVNDGHRLDKHFVPGLYVDDSGILSMDPERDVGMVVGTRTQYVPGLYMKEAGIEKYKEVAEEELRKLTGEMFK